MIPRADITAWRARAPWPTDARVGDLGHHRVDEIEHIEDDHLVIAKRTAIKRIHKLMKFDYGDETLSKRGTPAFQGRLDKTVLAMHLVIAHR